eukprot:scaffold131500_cov32-Attheya_sp.AAC.4
MVSEILLVDKQVELVYYYCPIVLLGADKNTRSDYANKIGGAEAIIRNWGNVVKTGTVSSLDRFFFTRVGLRLLSATGSPLSTLPKISP